MSPTNTRTEVSDTASDSHISRRRHAAQAGPNWVRRAGAVGGVAGTLALSALATSASADSAPSDGQSTTLTNLSILTAPDVTSEQATAAIDQTVVDLQLDAAQDDAVTDAKKAAARTKAADEKKAAAAKAADERAEAAASRSSERTSLAATSASTTSTAASGSIASVISFLKAQVGKPYVYGASGTAAYDCSSLTQAAFRTIGVELPRTSQAQSTFGTQVSVDNVQVGDLLFWGGVGSAYHVAVYIGDGQYLDAANPSKGVVIQQMEYYMPTSAVRVA